MLVTSPAAGNVPRDRPAPHAHAQLAATGTLSSDELLRASQSQLQCTDELHRPGQADVLLIRGRYLGY